jgi:hypothetical protein
VGDLIDDGRIDLVAIDERRGTFSVPVRLAAGAGKRLHPVRVLAQQVTQIGRGLAGGGDRQEHG